MLFSKRLQIGKLRNEELLCEFGESAKGPSINGGVTVKGQTGTGSTTPVFRL